MTPEYLEELADVADPEKLWRRAGLERHGFTPDQKRQLDTGVALRRHASHVRRLRELLGTGKSMLLTPLSLSGSDIRDVPMPADIKKRLKRENEHGNLPAASHCQNGGDVCLAGNHDGVCCPDDSCDIDDGMRKPPNAEWSGGSERSGETAARTPG